MRGNSHVRCGVGENSAITSKSYLSLYPDFDAKISIRQDHAHDFKTFDVGTYGLCISCAGEIYSKLLCDDCNHDNCLKNNFSNGSPKNLKAKLSLARAILSSFTGKLPSSSSLI